MLLAAKNYTIINPSSSSSSSSERITIVPPLSAAWLSDVVLVPIRRSSVSAETFSRQIFTL
jgi:hypothetical protein